MNYKTIRAAVIAAVAALTLAASAGAEVKFFTCVGGASGMTLQLNPTATGGVQRGCAPKMMDITLKQKNYPANSGTVKYAYTKVRMKASDPAWSEPTTFGTGQNKFTGDKSDCEIAYLKLSNGDILVGMCIRADSVLGLRFVVNRQYIYAFAPQSGTENFRDINGNPITDPDWPAVLSALQTWATSGVSGSAGIPIEGGLTECYMDSGIKAVDRWNRLFVTNPNWTKQPQLNPANYRQTKDNLLAVAVLAVIYNDTIEQWTGGQPLNVTTQMERMISGGMVDNWDVFFGQENGHMPLLNFYREPLSGTGITYMNLIMRGVETNPNGTLLTEDPDTHDLLPVCSTDGVNYHRSGIPDLTCVTSLTATCPANKPGGGAVNNAVDKIPGAHAYTFLQKFTPVTTPGALDHVRVAKFNGYEPYDFSSGNQLPGFGNVPDVDDNTNTTYYTNVIDGKYPLWTYNHCFDATNGASQNLADYCANYKLAVNAPIVRSVGLVALTDMETYAATRTKSTTGPNANRGKGLGRCGYESPITGEIVRDGMMFMLNDPNAPDGLPSEGYVEMRP